jgi:hypothetical protein
MDNDEAEQSTVEEDQFEEYVPSHHGKSTLYDYTSGVGNGK